ncbi:MAG: BamA/TamA family outer membrane protein [Ignavibacteria bacterium]
MIKLLSQIKIFSALLLLSAPLYAQVIEKITVSGADNFSPDEYITWSGINTGAKLFHAILDSVKQRISDKLQERGYYHSTLSGNTDTSSDKKSAVLFIHVNQGTPTLVRNVYCNGISRADSPAIQSIFNYSTNQILTKTEIENNVNKVIDYLEDKGQPFAGVSISSVNFMTDSLTKSYLADICLKTDYGKLSRIDKIEIKGNVKTRDFVILREADIHRGGLYSQKIINEIPKKLNRLRFFEPVGPPSYYFNSRDEGILSIQVKEKETNNFDGIIGYLPASGTDKKGYLTGLVNITLRNMFGSGRAVAIRWQQADKNSQELEIKYLEPWVLGYPFNINFGFFQQKQDTVYVRGRLDGAIEFLASGNISATLIFSSESIVPTVNTVPRFTVFNSTIITTGVNLKIDSRDDIYAPHEGVYLLNTYQFSKKKINGPAEYITPATNLSNTFQRFALDFIVYKGIYNNSVIAFGIHARELTGNGIEVSDLYRLGGTNSLRGYRESQFPANRLLWSNFELRQLLTRKTYAFLFLDSGYYLRNAEMYKIIEKQTGFRNGYGAGLNLETGLGMLSVSYALGNGDTFNSGKIHFGIINEF